MRNVGYRILISFLLPLALAPLWASASGDFILQFGAKGAKPGELGPDIYISVAPDGKIYVSDPFNRRVQVFDRSGRIVGVVEAGKPSPPGFEALGEIAASPYGFYVVDQQFLPVPGSENLYIHTSVVHQFDSHCRYIRTIAVDSLDVRLYGKLRLVPILTPEGEIAYSVMGFLERPFHISADEEGSLYLLDESRSRIYIYNREGELSLSFGELGLFDKACDIDVDRDGNIYVADKLNNRVVKFDSTGKEILSIGRRGRGHGEFIGPYMLSVTDRGELIVKDSISSERTFESYLPRRGEPVPEKEREYKERIERLQVFRLDGSFLREIPIRFDLSDPDEANLRLIGVDKGGRVFFYDVRKHTVKVNVYNGGFRWKDVRKCYTLRFEKDTGSLKIDSSDWDDLFDYLHGFNLRAISQSLLASYNINGRTGVHTEGRISILGGYRDYLFPGEKFEGEPPEETFLGNDYFLVDDRIEGEAEIGLDFVLDPDRYTYRELNVVFGIGGALHKFRYYTFSSSNLSHALQDLWEWRTNFKVSVDIGRDLNLSLDLRYSSPRGFMNYRYSYWDQYGALVYTSSYWDRGVTAVIGLNAVF